MGGARAVPPHALEGALAAVELDAGALFVDNLCAVGRDIALGGVYVREARHRDEIAPERLVLVVPGEGPACKARPLLKFKRAALGAVALHLVREEGVCLVAAVPLVAQDVEGEVAPKSHVCIEASSRRACLGQLPGRGGQVSKGRVRKRHGQARHPLPRRETDGVPPDDADLEERAGVGRHGGPPLALLRESTCAKGTEDGL
mmetsp:Transcript_35058/g.89584  ORF Transcript_35058/g.89584 Transcript_35058/m.89584 type:complete len:202 (+) Transcript_35058:383-988(+)